MDNIACDHEHDKHTSKSTNEEKQESQPSKMENEYRNLRRLLKLYFQPAFKFKGKSCTIHVFYCVLLLVNIAEMSLLTIQMFRVGNDRSHFSAIIKRENFALRNLFLEGWDAGWETLPYPPAHGSFAVYDIASIERKIRHIVVKSYYLQEEALGFFFSYGNIANLTIKYFDFDFDYKLSNKNGLDSAKLETKEISFQCDIGHLYNKYDGTHEYNLTADFEKHGIFYVPWNKFLSVTLSTSINSIKVFEDANQALCISTLLKFYFSDPDNTGQVLVSMESSSKKLSCKENVLNLEDWNLQAGFVNLGMVVIVICSIGLFCTLCTFAFGSFVLMRTKHFMRTYFKDFFQPDDPTESDLPIGEYFQFVSGWNICIVLSEVFTLYGTAKIVYKEETSSIGLDELDLYVIMLGVGCFFAWVSILRVVRFHKRFRLLLSTVWAASGDVFAYLLCVMIMFVGYFVTGYVVLGPYNIKFSTPSYSLETLSSLINGDEIFTTLNIFECEEHGLVWWFSRVYIWSYVAVFTIIVLNLFIAIFMSAYEIIKDRDGQNEDDAALGPLELALRTFIENQSENELRKALRDLMAAPHHCHSEDEQKLKSHLCNICHVSEDGVQIVLKKSRTLKALMRGGDQTNTFKCLGIDFTFTFLLRTNKNNYVVKNEDTA